MRSRYQGTPGYLLALVYACAAIQDLLAQLRLGNKLFLTNATRALRQESLHPSKQLSFSWGLILSKMDLLIIEGVAGACGSGYGLVYCSLRELYIWPRILIVFGLFVA